jgi:hypothetical protein
VIPVLSRSASRRRKVAASGGGGYTTAITSFAGSSTRNNFDGLVGFKFTMNANKNLHGISRKKLTGNSLVHQVHMFDAATGFLIASAKCDMSTGSVGDEIFVDFATDIPLVSGHSYWLLSKEEQGVSYDIWYEEAAVTSTADVTVNASIFLAFHNPLLPNNFTGKVGFKFTSTSAQTITHLGRYKGFDSDSGSHTLYLLDSSHATLASVSISNSGQPMGWVYGSLTSSVNLSAGGSYYVMSSETSGGDAYGEGVPTSLASDFTLNNAAYDDGTFHDYTAGIAFGVDFKFGSLQRGVTGKTDAPLTASSGKAYVYPNFKYS